MNFSEAYHLYVQGIDVKPYPFCSETKADLFFEMFYGEGLPGLEYYKKYLESCGDISAPVRPLICYDVYMKLYAKKFERDLRQSVVNNPKSNRDLCGVFNVPVRYNDVTFDKLPHHPEQEKQRAAAWKWAQGLKGSGQEKDLRGQAYEECLLLGGVVRGIGKTSLLVCTTMQYYVDNDFRDMQPAAPAEIGFLNSSIVFIKERQFMDLMNRNDVYKSMVLERLSKVDFLAYDDLLLKADEIFVKKYLLDLIDSRIDCEGKPTALTTAYPRHLFEKNYPDMYSRLSRGKIDYSNQQTDLRKKQRKD
jgi:hypothetical protein